MPELTRFQFALLAVVVATVVFVGARALRASADHPAGAGPSDAAAFTATGADGSGADASPVADPAAAGGTAAAESGPASPAEPSGVTTAGGANPDGADAAGGVVLVHVAGAVRHPGLYRLPATARVGDAVERAGGARGRADLDAVNLAAKLEDGEQVLVPRRGRTGDPTGSAAGIATAAGAATVTPSAAAAGSPAAIVDLNRATVAELDTLDGVGPAIAQKILDYRTQHGAFRSVEELAQVPGIGPKKLAAIRPRVRIG